MLFLVFGALGAGLLVAGVAVFRRRKLLGAPIALLGVALLALAVAVVVFLQGFRIPSEAMVATLKPDDRIMVLKGPDPERGDLVVFHPPAGAISDSGPQCGRDVGETELCGRSAGGRAGVTFVKRVVAVGGDEVAMRDGKVVLNGEPLDEPYTRPCGTGAGCDYPEAIRIPRGQVFLLGDNRGFSDDSRFWGPVREEWVVGRVLVRYWPLGRVGAP